MFAGEGVADFDFIAALTDVDDDRFPYDLLVQLAVVHHQSGVLADVLTPIVVALSDQLRSLTLNKDFGRYIRGIGKLVSIKPIAELLVDWPSFNPSTLPARAFEVASLLGPLFRLSVFGCDDLDLATGHFGQPFQRTRANVDAAFHSLRLSLDTLQRGLYDIVFTLIKTSPAARIKVLDFFGSILLQVMFMWSQLFSQNPYSRMRIAVKYIFKIRLLFPRKDSCAILSQFYSNYAIH
jgi:ubiquitin conjugation factor E4 B